MTILFLFLFTAHAIFATTATDPGLPESYVSNTTRLLQRAGVSDEEIARMLGTTFPEPTQAKLQKKAHPSTIRLKKAGSLPNLGLQPHSIFDPKTQMRALETILKSTQLSQVITPPMVVSIPQIGLWAASLLASDTVGSQPESSAGQGQFYDDFDPSASALGTSVETLMENGPSAAIRDHIISHIDEDGNPNLSSIGQRSAPSARSAQSTERMLQRYGLDESDHKHLAWATLAYPAIEKGVQLHTQRHAELANARLAFLHAPPTVPAKSLKRSSSKSKLSGVQDNQKIVDARQRMQQLLDTFNAHITSTDPEQSDRSLRSDQSKGKISRKYQPAYSRHTPEELDVSILPAIAAQTIVEHTPSMVPDLLTEASAGMILQEGLLFYVTAVKNIRSRQPLDERFIRAHFKGYDDGRIIAILNATITVINRQQSQTLEQYLSTPENASVSLLSGILNDYFHQRLSSPDDYADLMHDQARLSSLALNYLLAPRT